MTSPGGRRRTELRFALFHGTADLGDGDVGIGIGAALVLAQLDQQFDFLVLGHVLAQQAGRLEMLVVDHAGHGAAEADQGVDGRIVVSLRQLARQIDVAVEDGADLFADGVAAFLESLVDLQ